VKIYSETNVVLFSCTQCINVFLYIRCYRICTWGICWQWMYAVTGMSCDTRCGQFAASVAAECSWWRVIYRGSKKSVGWDKV